VNPFFVLPGSALISLREELEILEGDHAGETLERMGFGAGRSLVASIDASPVDLHTFPEVFSQLWSESGLSRAKVIAASTNAIEVHMDGSLEAERGRPCDFARGYLCGITSALLGRRYSAIETECTSKGAEACVHRLIPSDDLVASPRKAASGNRKYELEPGCSYLIEAERGDKAFRIFEEHLAHGHPGMAVVREYPEKLRKAYRLEGAVVRWLSYEHGIREVREPTNIPLIYSELKSFIESNQGSVLVISGLEYLVSQNSFVSVLKFVQLLSESASVNDAIFLLPVSPGALSAQEVKLLEREFRGLPQEISSDR